MDKRDRAQIFRRNMLSAMDTANLKSSQLADQAGIDRSTLGQLLSENAPRLPNGHTLAELASVLGVSSDWLLGLSQQAQPVTTLLDGALNFTPSLERAPMDSNLEEWFREASGYKIRHVPSTLPDMLKTNEVLRYEYRDFAVKTGEQAITERDLRQSYIRMPDVEMEICIPVQRFAQFADGSHIWQDIPKKTRMEQIEYMAELTEELYPRVRIYGFDLRTHYSVPVTIFGPLRAVIYIGQGYFVLNTSGHIRPLARHFDELVRNATVQAHEMPTWMRGHL
ncbi:helix-turn-helix domain-containing protein [Sneathiella sp. P13V-1]|uniref:helix-turn-helix domain-containing protein n=1 Tax=Sneathiella sp. P13V-1 TaxID=2697366 RepID=UPI00187B3DDA|nr:helix-turn-helix transcriptional regulator [Sneathiella sp. P13V-1]MBE7636592.1 helix-turn-helix domain-containing protein [Sneathiella sp. P13V-1]